MIFYLLEPLFLTDISLAFTPLSTAPPSASFSSFSKKSSIYSKNKQFFLSNNNYNGDHYYNQPFTQVISDVDDTLKSSGGVNVGGIALGGIDVQYKRGDFYPGVFQFMLELSCHSLSTHKNYITSNNDATNTNNTTSSYKFQPAKPAILTARAEEFKAALEIKGSSKLAIAFRETGRKAGYNDWGIGPVLYGSVTEWVVQVRKGLRKFSNFERLIQQDPTGGKLIQYVYVGDTGELDQEAGEQMLRYYPELVKAVFLHVVSQEQWDGDRYVPIPPAKLINGRPLVFFRTYVGAAAKATQLGLMGDEGLKRVMRAAEEALIDRSVPKESNKWRDLEMDISDALRTISSRISSEQFFYK